MTDEFKDLIAKLQGIENQRDRKMPFKVLSAKESANRYEIWTKEIKDILIKTIKDCSLSELDYFIAAFKNLCLLRAVKDKKKEVKIARER